MDSDERQILDYLKSWPRQFVSAREVARRAGGKRRFRDEPQWAYPVLTRLLEQKQVETDGLGHYRLVLAALTTKRRKRWISPHLRRILERSGRDFGDALDIPEESDASGQ
jgi:hypothetical protein